MKTPQSSFQDTLRALLVGASAGLVLALVFAGGFLFRDVMQQARVEASDASTTFPLLDEVQALLQHVYLRPLPDETAQQYGAIRGLLATLNDGNTFFIEPPVARSEADALAGTYGGIGVLLRRHEDGYFVLTPYPDSPAAQAGILDGDVLVAVNQAAIDPAQQQQDAVDQMMRGEVKTGSGVEITVRHADETEMTVFIEFAVINVPSVLWRIMPEDGRIGYLQVIRFTNRTPDEVAEALAALQAANIEALIFDLRSNTGGLLDESIRVASLFIPDGPIAYERNRNSERALDSQGGTFPTDIPMVILVNDHTASASEIVAGALRDRGRAVLLGQNTYGKGTVQQIFPLSDGSSVHITSAEWLTPNKTPLEGVGLAPDLPMIPAENGRDIESAEALRYLQQQLDTSSEPSS